MDDFPAGALSADAVAIAQQKQRLLQEAQIAAAASLKATSTAAAAALRATSRAKAKASSHKSPSKRSTGPPALTRGRKRAESVGK